MKKNVRFLALLVLAAVLIASVPVATYAEATMVVTGDFVNMRAGVTGTAGHSNILNKGNELRKGETVVDIGGGSQGGWYYVQRSRDGVKGYVWGEYLKYQSSSSSSKTTTTTTNKTTTTTTTNNATAAANRTKAAIANAPVTRNNDTVRATITKPVTIYSTASASSKSVGTLKTRTTVSVLSRKNDYVFITTSKMSGYVRADSLTLTNTRSYTAKVRKVTNGNYNVYAGSTGTGAKIAAVKPNATVTVIHQGSTWSYVKVGNVYGYVAKDVLEAKKG